MLATARPPSRLPLALRGCFDGSPAGDFQIAPREGESPRRRRFKERRRRRGDELTEKALGLALGAGARWRSLPSVCEKVFNSKRDLSERRFRVSASGRALAGAPFRQFSKSNPPGGVPQPEEGKRTQPEGIRPGGSEGMGAGRSESGLGHSAGWKRGDGGGAFRHRGIL